MSSLRVYLVMFFILGMTLTSTSFFQTRTVLGQSVGVLEPADSISQPQPPSPPTKPINKVAAATKATATPEVNAARIAELEKKVADNSEKIKQTNYYNVRQSQVLPNGEKKNSGRFAKKPITPPTTTPPVNPLPVTPPTPTPSPTPAPPVPSPAVVPKPGTVDACGNKCKRGQCCGEIGPNGYTSRACTTLTCAGSGYWNYPIYTYTPA